MTLTEFLLARIAEDEHLAQAATPGAWVRDSGWSVVAPPPEDWDGPYVVVETKQRNDAEFVASQNPTRVLAECAAKRRIVEAAWNLESFDFPEGGVYAHTVSKQREILHALATVYSDHPDYRDEWKP